MAGSTLGPPIAKSSKPWRREAPAYTPSARCKDDQGILGGGRESCAGVELTI